MNKEYGDARDTALDYGLVEETQRLQSTPTAVPFNASNQARATLWVHDYGGSTKVLATTTSGGYQSDLLNLPNNVTLPDHDDETGPGNNQLPGDRLSVWEEYRGFYALDNHVRLHPDLKDLFYYHLDPTLNDFNAGFASGLGIQLWKVRSYEVQGAGVDSWINFNSINHPSGLIPGHQVQRALQIEEGGFNGIVVGECILGMAIPRMSGVFLITSNGSESIHNRFAQPVRPITTKVRPIPASTTER
jgi:hypothetical protein